MKLSKSITSIAILICFFAIAFVSCSKAPDDTQEITSEEAKAIAEEAFIYAYPILMGYRAIYLGAIDEKSSFYRAPFNQIVHDSSPADHTREDVVTINGDTPYSNFGIDLRAEPMVVSVSDVPDRYYVIQFADLFTHNFEFVGTRATGNKAGDYLFVGPKWKGEVPTDKFSKVIRCETDFAVAIGRTQLLGVDDMPNVEAIQQGYKVTPLSVFMGEEPKTAPDVDWLPWKQDILSSIEFIKYLNFLLTFIEPIHPDDQALMERFSKIGIVPGGTFDASSFDDDIKKAVEEGIAEGTKKITNKAQNIAEQVNGWNMMEAFGPRGFFKGDWLLRAAAAMAAIYANDKIEAFYPMAFVDKDGDVLNGKTDNYVLHFTKDEIPPAKYFWSVTMYDKRADGVAGYMIDNPIDRYLINSTTEGLIYDEEGGLTIYIQHEKPEGAKSANWLPAPAEPFYLAMRVYGPEERVLSGKWIPPAVMKAKAEPIAGLGLSEKEVVDSYLYILARYLVIRQEHIDMTEEGIDYNVIKYNELGKAEFVNPNLDVAYLEAWFAVDENTPVILDMPKIEGRYYTAQIVDEWAEITHNINERNFPDHPYGQYALCLKGSNPEIPEGAMRIAIPSKKAKMLARVERKGDDEGALKLQRAFKIIKTGEPKIAPAIEIPKFTNKDLIRVAVFEKPMVERVLSSALDTMTTAADHQKKVLAIADFIGKSEANKTMIDTLIKEKAIPAFIKFTMEGGDSRHGWTTTREWSRFGDDFWFRAAANYAGIWWNSSIEVVYYMGIMDKEGLPLHGDNTYVIHYKLEDLPMNHVGAYWSLTMLSLPDYRVVPNRLEQYNRNNISSLQYEPDGSLKIYLGSELPTGLPESNWLPSPKGRSFTVNNRFYVPKKEVLTGEWYVPPIEKIK